MPAGSPGPTLNRQSSLYLGKPFMAITLTCHSECIPPCFDVAGLLTCYLTLESLVLPSWSPLEDLQKLLFPEPIQRWHNFCIILTSFWCILIVLSYTPYDSQATLIILIRSRLQDPTLLCNNTPHSIHWKITYVTLNSYSIIWTIA